MRIRKKPWAEPELNASPFVVKEPKSLRGKWREQYPNPEAQFYLELGCGKGGWISQACVLHPEINFVALDIKAEMLAWARRKVDRSCQEKGLEVNHVKLAITNIMDIQSLFSPQDKVNRIYINFCNPWPKAGYKMRRLTHTRQLLQYREFLDGELWFKTDDTLLFRESLPYFEEAGYEILFQTEDLHRCHHPENIMTEHEKMFLEEGKNIKFLIARPIEKKGGMDMKSTLLKNVHLVTPTRDEMTDIFIKGQKITEISENIQKKADLELNCQGLTAIPALFDMHVHFRDPGLTYKEDIDSGISAAYAGGVVGAACMPNTKPACDTPQIVEYMQKKAENRNFYLYPVACITEEMKGEKLCDYEALAKAGVKSVSDDGRPVEQYEMMKEACEKAYAQNLLVISHCEDLAIINGGIMNQGAISEKLGVKGMDRASENSITAREIQIAKETGTRVHIAHVSTKECVDYIRKAKAEGVAVTCETCPHYFMLTDELLLSRDADYRMNPPLREQADVDAILEAVTDGTIDCIVTDHAPHAKQEKENFETAPNGVVGLETSFAASYTTLVKSGKITLAELIQRMSEKPIELLGAEPFQIEEGSVANLTLINLEQEWEVIPEKLHSKSHNTVFKGRKFYGKVKATFAKGEMVFAEF